MIRPDCWRNRRVFLTGHTGFKGSWLTLALHGLGANISGYALEPLTSPSLFALADIAALAGPGGQNINDPTRLKTALAAAQPEIVFHMAAQPLVRQSYADPVGTWATNVMGTINLLEAVRAAPSVKAVIVVTSDKAYAHAGTEGGCKEADPLGGDDPYAGSKGATEIAVHSWRHSFFRHPTSPLIASVRAGNVIGGGDWSADRIITDAVKAFMQGGQVSLRYPQATRPWQHVLDALVGYLLLGQRLLDGDRACATAYNFGPDAADAQPVHVLVEKLAAHFGITAPWVQAPGEHPPEAPALTLDAAKARRELQWQPLVNLDDALRLTADWFKAWAGGEDMRMVTEQQIARVLRHASATQTDTG